MTGTADLSGGDTLAGGGAAEGGDRMLGLLLGAGCACAAWKVSGNLRREAPAARTWLVVDDNDFFIIAGILSDRYQARSITLAPLAHKGLWSRRACRHRADGCMQA